MLYAPPLDITALAEALAFTQGHDMTNALCNYCFADY